MKSAKPKLKPLAIKIPLDYAEILGVDRSHLSHVNAGRRPLSRDHCYTLLEASLTDPRLEGLHILTFRPEDIRSKRWLSVPYPPPKSPWLTPKITNETGGGLWRRPWQLATDSAYGVESHSFGRKMDLASLLTTSGFSYTGTAATDG